jgi:hypothetical protein
VEVSSAADANVKEVSLENNTEFTSDEVAWVPDVPARSAGVVQGKHSYLFSRGNRALGHTLNGGAKATGMTS